jgi:uncharacterized protein YggE
MRLILFITAFYAAMAQTSDGISVPVSRTVSLLTDEVTFTIRTAATLDSTAQQVKQALQAAGLPNPTVVGTGLGPDNSNLPLGGVQILYTATVTIPASSAMDAGKRLDALRTQLTDPLRSLQYSFTSNASQAAVDAMRQVVMPQLMDDARKRAQSLAAASGVKMGAVRSISDSPAGAYGVLVPGSPGGLGDFPILIAPPSTTQYTYYLNVVFAAQ